jgi:site-specific DNA-methyltransferase (adenine-specific)
MLTDVSARPENRPNPIGGPGTGIHPTTTDGAAKAPGDDPDGLGCAPMAKRARTRAATEFQAETPSDPFSLQTIYCGDNLDKLSRMPAKCVDLIYIDPPFNSNRNYEVFWGEAKETRRFEDRSESTKANIDFMRPRCEQLARVLKTTGSFYYHCDWHASHYVKVMLDRIFGENNFRTEIVWKRSTSHGNVSRNYGTLFDSIFFYAKSDNYTWNQQYADYSPEYIKTKFVYKDDNGRVWRSVTLRNPSPRPNLHYPFTASNGVTYQPHPNGWSCNLARMEKYDREGRLHFPAKPGGQLNLKMYLDELKGVKLQNTWMDIPAVNSQAIERKRIGYPTQKPRPLLERIIRTSSDPDDIVLDAFCGCGTALEAAQRLDRRWIGIDISPTACRVMSERLRRECLLTEGRDFFVRDLPKTAEQLRNYPHFEFENWAVNALNTVVVNGRAIGNKVKVGDMGIDGRIYPIRADKTKTDDFDLFGPSDDWLPVQVKQVDTVSRDEIDGYYGAMKRQKRTKGFFISFGFSSGALKEMRRLHDDPHDGLEIIPLTVDEILAEEVRYRV